MDESLWFLGLGLANVRWPLADSAFLCMLLTRVLTSGIVLMLYIFRKLNQRGPRDPEITSSGAHGHRVSPTVTQQGHNVPRAAFVPKMSNLNLMKKPRDRCKPRAVLQSTRTALFEMSASWKINDNWETVPNCRRLRRCDNETRYIILEWRKNCYENFIGTIGKLRI